MTNFSMTLATRKALKGWTTALQTITGRTVTASPVGCFTKIEIEMTDAEIAFTLRSIGRKRKGIYRVNGEII